MEPNPRGGNPDIMKKVRKPDPPRLANRFFQWYCRNELQDSILGDMHERFDDQTEKFGAIRARWRYWLMVFRFMNRHTLRSVPNTSNSFLNLQGSLRSSVRYLRRHKGYALLNIGGLATGLACCLLIYHFLRHELSYDQFHSHTDQVFRINTLNYDAAGNFEPFANTAPALAPGIRGVFPQVESISQLRYALRSNLRVGDRGYFENGGFYADSVFLEMFDFPWLAGDRASALDEPNSVVITKDLAMKYFNQATPIGEILTLNNAQTLEITGVLDNIPSNSHIQFDFLVSFSTYRVPDGYFSDLTSWRWLGFLTYVQLSPEADPKLFNSLLNDLYQSKLSGSTVFDELALQPLKDIYFGSTGVIDDLASPLRSGSFSALSTLTIIAVMVLLIAAFNFANLSVAMALNRGKEMGLRKIIGATRSILIFQSLMEAWLVSIAALAVAYLLFWTSYPLISDLVGWQWSLSIKEVVWEAPFVILIVIALASLAALYPAILLARLKVDRALSQIKVRGGSTLAKNVMVVTQFTMALALIVATLVVSRQLSYLRTQEMGFDSERVMVVKLPPGDMTRYYDRFKKVLLQSANVVSVSRSERLIGEPWPVNSVRLEGQSQEDAKMVAGNLVDFDYLETIGAEIKAGRSFDEAFATDSLQSIIINERAANYLGLEDAIGRKLHFFDLQGPRTVIGVVDDFHFSSLHEDVGPMVMVIPFIAVEQLYIRLSPGLLNDRIREVATLWEQVAPGVTLEWKFMDDHLNTLYEQEERLANFITGFSILAIILSCLGLYGLVAFMVRNRMKEVGIRKVLGASIPSLVKLLGGHYALLLAVAVAMALPSVSWLLERWLENYPYRIQISWAVHLVAIGTLGVVAVVTICAQAISAALTDPARILRDE